MFDFLAKFVSTSKLYELLYKLSNFIEVRSKTFFTYHERPILAYDIASSSTQSYSHIAIVMQGPLLLEKNFTFETIKLYQKMFNKVLIILSTWEDENAECLKQIESLNIIILQNKKPEFNGPSNINLQIKTTSRGLLKAKELGVKYALKTRTDQRIYNAKTLDLLDNLITTFAIDNNTVQQNRIVVTSLATLKYRMYGITDMLMFGDINDMWLYWNVGYDLRSIDQTVPMNIAEFSKMRICEIYLCTEFLKKIGRNIEWTLADSWRVYADHFCIIDHSLISVYWYKYGRKLEYRYKYYDKHSLELFDFSDWLNAVNGKTETVDEKILECKFGEKIQIS